MSAGAVPKRVVVGTRSLAPTRPATRRWRRRSSPPQATHGSRALTARDLRSRRATCAVRETPRVTRLRHPQRLPEALEWCALGVLGLYSVLPVIYLLATALTRHESMGG